MFLDDRRSVPRCKRCGRAFDSSSQKCSNCGSNRVGYVPALLIFSVMVLLLELVLIVV